MDKFEVWDAHRKTELAKIDRAIDKQNRKLAFLKLLRDANVLSSYPMVRPIEDIKDAVRK